MFVYITQNWTPIHPLSTDYRRGWGGVNNLLKTEKDKQKEKEKNTKDIYLYIN